ncbi:hypothetical protein CL614_08815 [archaeon]|nr:hypothetical protein [archaeon]|tara:strand:+ start:1864 stop:2832 length:969 start_codon:yes stop_codon:yes gene_type:complete
METNLNIFGIKILINSNKEISDWISYDYSRYISKQITNPNLTFNLSLEKPNQENLPELTATTYHDDYIIYDSKSTRIIDFFGSALSIYKTKENTINIYCQDKDKLYEIFYLSFESLLGEKLDKNNFNRIHCLALEKNNKATIILLPPGAGKTTLALKFLETKTANVLTEDILLIKNKKLYGLHTRWGTRDKTQKGRLMKREKHSDKKLIDAKTLSLTTKALPSKLIIGKRISSNKSKIKKIPKHKLFIPLFKSMVLGLELQQSLAYFLLRNFKDGFSKANIAASRLSSMLTLLNKTQTYEFLIGYNIKKNYNTLNKFINPNV